MAEKQNERLNPPQTHHSSRNENVSKIIGLLCFHCDEPCDYYYVMAPSLLPLAYPLPIFRENDRGRSNVILPQQMNMSDMPVWTYGDA